MDTETLTVPGVPLAGTVTLICEHGTRGALGIVLNKPLTMRLSEVLEQMKLAPEDPGVGEQIILVVSGNVETPAYRRTIDDLTGHLMRMPEVISVLSLTRGPAGLDQARSSPLWSRLLIAGDNATLILALISPRADLDDTVDRISALARRFETEGVKISLSGAPYIVHQIRRNLVRDLRVFGVTVFVVFGIMALLLFRSLRLVYGMLLACADASMLALIVNEQLGVRVGLLTANVATIVFVLTLAHTVFFLFNWRRAAAMGYGEDSVGQAMRVTLPASWWSMVTTFFGFFSLLFVAAEPLRNLGIAGSVGTVCAFAAAYPEPGLPGLHDAGPVQPVDQGLRSRWAVRRR